MNYLDSSILLARVFSEPRAPAASFWLQEFISSRLLEYEVFNRIHARGGDAAHLDNAHRIFHRVNLSDLAPAILARALEPFSVPIPVRTLDAMHLATMVFLRDHGQTLQLASYDMRLAAAAQALGFPLAEI